MFSKRRTLCVVTREGGGVGLENARKLVVIASDVIEITLHRVVDASRFHVASIEPSDRVVAKTDLPRHILHFLQGVIMAIQSLRIRAFAFVASVAVLAFSNLTSADPPSRVARVGYMTGNVSFSPSNCFPFLWFALPLPLPLPWPLSDALALPTNAEKPRRATLVVKSLRAGFMVQSPC